jgi:hypothetical protein
MERAPFIQRCVAHILWSEGVFYVLISTVNTELCGGGLFSRRRRRRWASTAAPWPSAVVHRSGGWHALQSTTSSGSELKSKWRSRGPHQGVFHNMLWRRRSCTTARWKLVLRWHCELAPMRGRNRDRLKQMRWPLLFIGLVSLELGEHCSSAAMEGAEARVWWRKTWNRRYRVLLYIGVLLPDRAQQDYGSTLSPIGVWTEFCLGFGRFLVGEGTLRLGHASTKKTSSARARAGYWAACERS